MAVQAQYPSNILLLNRNEQDSKNLMLGGTNNNYSLQQESIGEGFNYQSHTTMFFNNNNGVGANPRKRGREITTPTPPTTTTTNNSFNFSLQTNQNQLQNHQIIDLTQLQNHPKNPTMVSTGLKLSFEEQNKRQQIQDTLSYQFKQQTDELNHFLNVQGEQLRQMLAEKRQRHYRTILDKVEETVVQRLREKEAEVETAVRQNAELHTRAAQISAEAQAWRAKAQDQEAQAMTLQAQIQQAILRPNTTCGPIQQDTCGSGPGDAEDAESVYIDPENEKRVNMANCKSCCRRVATVVLLPCRHLCVCVGCDERVQACPVCYSLRSASVEVYFS